MSLAGALRFGFALPVRHVWTVLPFYLLATSVTVAGRVPLLVGLAVVVVLLRVDGRLEALVRAFDRLEPGQLDPADPESVPPDLLDAFAGLVTPTVVAILGLSLLASLILWLVLQSVAAAGTVSAVYAALDGREPLTDGVVGLVRHWRTFLGLTFLRTLVVGVGVGLLVLGGVIGVAVGGVVGLVFGLLVGGVALGLILVTTAALSFVEPAVVVDDAGVVGSVRGSLGFIRRNPVEFLGYLVVTVGVTVGFATAAGLANLAGVPQAAAVATPLVVGPVLGGFQTALYARVDRRGRRSDAVDAAEWDDETVVSETAETRSVSRRVRSGAGRGWHALRAFVVAHPLANFSSAVLLAGGIAGGWLLTAPYGVAFDPPGDVAGVFGTLAVGPFVNIAANNWLVAASGGYAGLALGVPTVAMVLFNGVLVGALAGVFDRLAFVALVAPHGVVELPALAVSGGLGLHLGRVGLDGLRGRTTASEVGAELGEAFEVLVGLALVFVVASFIEAFLTPQIAAFVLDG